MTLKLSVLCDDCTAVAMTMPLVGQLSMSHAHTGSLCLQHGQCGSMVSVSVPGRHAVMVIAAQSAGQCHHGTA